MPCSELPSPNCVRSWPISLMNYDVTNMMTTIGNKRKTFITNTFWDKFYRDMCASELGIIGPYMIVCTYGNFAGVGGSVAQVVLRCSRFANVVGNYENPGGSVGGGA